MTLLDSFGRAHTYLRLSITDRCNFRCVYCLPKEGVQWQDRSDLLTYEEIARVVHIFGALGIKKIRITGGEPTMRADIARLIFLLKHILGIEEINMTTNGYTLKKLAKPLLSAGLSRLNVSLDTLDPQTFQKLSRGFSLEPVLTGIQEAKKVGFRNIKINAVLLKGINDRDLWSLLSYCSEHQLSLRFIEYMPFEARWYQCVTEEEIRNQISTKYTLIPQLKNKTTGPAVPYFIPELNLNVGFISPLSKRFCQGCNRLRLMSNGSLRTCLAHEDVPSLRDLLRAGATDTKIAEQIQSQVYGKAEGHFCNVDSGSTFQGIMTKIGG
ncbi:MAG: GTP 3',8-cyclase MoaA [Myxococcota bacterium]|nr:GTP 3',8-cyclase MoaA [Myxococcota bacterium]